MTETELREQLDLVIERIFYRAENNSLYRFFFKQARPVECNGVWYAAPVRFEESQWKKRNYINDLVRRMNDKLNHSGFYLRGEVKIFLARPFCYLIFGRDEIAKFNASNGQERVNVKLGDTERYVLLEFKCGKAVELKVNSQQKGWLFLYCIDASGSIAPVYPKRFGMESDIWITTNSDFDYSGFANKRRKAKGLSKWKFCGDVYGPERLFALVVDYPEHVVVDEEYILETYSYPLLFAHRNISRGVDGIPEKKAVNLSDIEDVDAVIGFADYVYQA